MAASDTRKIPRRPIEIGTVWSNRIQASVFSLAGAPSFGSCWMKSEMAGTIRYSP